MLATSLKEVGWFVVNAEEW